MKYGTLLCVVFHFLLPFRSKYKINDMTLALVCFAIGIVCYMLSRSMKNEQAAKEDIAKSEAYNRLLEEEIPCQCGTNIIQLCESIKTSSKVIEQWMDEPESEEAESIRTSEGDLRLSRYMIQCLVDQVERAKHSCIEREYIEISTAGDMLLWYRQVLDYLKSAMISLQIIIERMSELLESDLDEHLMISRLKSYALAYGKLRRELYQLKRICEQQVFEELTPLMKAVYRLVSDTLKQLDDVPLIFKSQIEGLLQNDSNGEQQFELTLNIKNDNALFTAANDAAKKLFEMWVPSDERIQRHRSKPSVRVVNNTKVTVNGDVAIHGDVHINTMIDQRTIIDSKTIETTNRFDGGVVLHANEVVQKKNQIEEEKQ